MGGWKERCVEDSVSPEMLHGADLPDPTKGKRPVAPMARSRSAGGRTGSGCADTVSKADHSALASLMSSIISALSVNEMCEVLALRLPAVIHFDVCSLKWKAFEPLEDDTGADLIDTDCYENAEFTSAENKLTGPEPLSFDLPSSMTLDDGGPSSAYLEGTCRARTETGEPVIIRFHSVLLVPLVHKDERIGLLTLLSSRENGFSGNEVDDLKDLWKVLGTRLGQVLERDDLIRDRDSARELVDSSSDLVIVWKQKGNVWEINCNKRAEELVQREDMRPELMDGPFFVPPGSDRERSLEAWRNAFERRESSEVDIELTDRDGGPRTFICTFAPIMDGEQVIGVKMSGTASERLSKGLAELGSANRSYRRLFWELENGLREHLSSIKGYSGLVGKSGKEKASDYGRRISVVSEKMEDTLLYVRSLMQIRTGEIRKEFEGRDLVGMVNCSLDILSAEPNPPKIRFVHAENELTVDCHSLTKDVVMGLARSAIDHAAEGSEVVLELRSEIEGATLSARIEGEVPCIDTDEDILTMISRGEKDDMAPVTSLRLSFMRAMMELHGGKLMSSNDKDGTACLSIFFPWSPAVEPM